MIIMIHWMKWALVMFGLNHPSIDRFSLIHAQVDARSPADSWTPLLAVTGLSLFLVHDSEAEYIDIHIQYTSIYCIKICEYV